MTSDVIKTRNGLIITVAVMAVIIFGIGLFIADNKAAWFAGMAVGTLLSIGRVLFLTGTLNKTADMDKETASRVSQAHYMLRYMGTLVIAVLAIILGAHPIGVIVGLILVQPAVYIYNFIFNKQQ